MENLVTRYRNVTILVAILFAQVLGLAIQVKRSSDRESTRLIRIWAVDTITPLEKGIVWFQLGTSNLWHNYIYLRGVRQENRDLKQQIENLRLEQVRINEDARQARRLQTLLGFKEEFVAQTMAAQVIGLSGSEQSRSFYIDKGSSDGIDKDMAVMTADGVVGKVLRVFGTTSQVLLINDQSSGVGTILETSRLQGVLRGTVTGDVILDKIMNDEQVQPGEKVLTSGGDQIFPKGLLLGTIARTSHGPEAFLNIRVKPAADLSKLEEVLVITKKEDREPEVADSAPVRAVDVLAERLPSVPEKPAADAAHAGDNPPAATPAKKNSNNKEKQNDDDDVTVRKFDVPAENAVNAPPKPASPKADSTMPAPKRSTPAPSQPSQPTTEPAPQETSPQ